MAPTQPKKMSTLNAFFPPAPTFTDANLPSQKGRVIIVTGAASGVGFELAKILYLAGGTVYIAARSTSRCEGAIQKLLEQTADMEIGKGGKGKGKGKLQSMVVDLADLGTVKPAVESFLEKEERLDVLVHNAAVMTPPAGSKDKMVSLTKPFLDVAFASVNKWCDRATISNLERIV
jgi:retinol dehydrogenase-12